MSMRGPFQGGWSRKPVRTRINIDVQPVNLPVRKGNEAVRICGASSEGADAVEAVLEMAEVFVLKGKRALAVVHNDADGFPVRQVAGSLNEARSCGFGGKLQLDAAIGLGRDGDEFRV